MKGWREIDEEEDQSREKHSNKQKKNNHQFIIKSTLHVKDQEELQHGKIYDWSTVLYFLKCFNICEKKI